MLLQLSVKSCASVDGCRGNLACAKQQSRNHGDGSVTCNLVPVNNTYINICTIKSILVYNTAEDANTNKQTQ